MIEANAVAAAAVPVESWGLDRATKVAMTGNGAAAAAWIPDLRDEDRSVDLSIAAAGKTDVAVTNDKHQSLPTEIAAPAQMSRYRQDTVACTGPQTHVSVHIVDNGLTGGVVDIS